MNPEATTDLTQLGKELPASAEPTRPASTTKLFLHIGMPKTGTSAAQHVLAHNAPALRARGYVYPDQWMGDLGGHNVLTDRIRKPAQAPAISGEVCRYLSERRGESVILSAEGLAGTLLATRRRRAFADFVAQCLAIADTRVVMALRRIDEFLASVYLQVTKMGMGDGTLTPEEYLASRGSKWTDELFSGIRWFRDQSEAELVLIPYLEDEDFLPQLLAALGLDDPTDLRLEPTERVNRRLGLKAQSVFLLPDRALDVLGVKRRTELADLFRSGEFEFRDEVYEYDVLGGELRGEIHARALERARECGIDEYTDAFADAEPGSAPRARIDSSLITATDLSDLANVVEAQKWSRRPTASKRSDGPRLGKRQTGGGVAGRPTRPVSGRP
jgi:hypothetical protein